MSQKNIAVVTGASGGFGREFVRFLLREPNVDEIWAIARKEEKLYQICTEFGKKVKPLPLDLSNSESRKKLGEQLQSDSGLRIRFLINNAGYAKFGAWDDISIEESENLIELNCKAVVSLCLLCIPRMQPGSHILNIASQAAFQPLPYLNLYSATKTFVRNYSRALNVELKERDITVTAVCPGWMRTPFYDRAQTGAQKAPNVFNGMVPPERVAAKALLDAKHKRDISVYGTHIKLQHLAAKLLPQRTMMELWLRQQHLK